MIVAAVQVRMGSTRLPGKALADIVGRPILWHIVNRLGFAHYVSKVVIATSDGPGDAAIRAFAQEQGIPCFAGSEWDVLGRLYHTACAFGASALVRITGDCPLVDPEVVDKVVAAYLTHPESCDYVSNVSPPPILMVLM